jgi:isopropylmalate/homocitrate/citramalate synthase
MVTGSWSGAEEGAPPMSATPWKTESWFTSPWNHDPEAVAGHTPSDSVVIHDVTLRDGEQQSGVEFTADDKVRIAEALADAGIQRIEAGLPAVSPADTEAVRRIAALGLPAEVYAFSRCMVDDVKLAVDCGVSGVVMEVPSSRHLIELGYRWTVERAIELSVEATNYAHEHGLKVSFFPIDATRASLEDYLNLIDRVATDGHMDALVLVDTFGVLAPHAVERFVRTSKERFNVPLETHFHMDYGLGIANSLIAVAAGASVVQTTVTGIGERAGNVPVEETVMALLTLYNRDIGIKTEKLFELSELIKDLSQVRQAPNRAVVGETLFDVESGIIATWVRNVRDQALTECVPYDPRLVGQTGPRIVLGKGSGVDNVREYLERIGRSTSDEDELMDLLREVKAASLAKRSLLDEDDFRAIVDKVLGAA